MIQALGHHQSAFSKYDQDFSVILSTTESQSSIRLQDYLNVAVAYESLCEKVTPLEENAFTISTQKMEKLRHRFFGQLKSAATDRSAPLSTDVVNPLSELISLSDRQRYLTFGEKSSHPMTSCFDLYYPSRFEFGGITYPSALHAFYAQMYPGDEPLQKRCASAEKLEDLLSIVSMKGNRCPYWRHRTKDFEEYREEVMWHVQLAKFGQNPILLHHLLSTLDAYLIPTAKVDDGFWMEGKTGKGNMRLGLLLMRVREHYGGIGIPGRPESLDEVLRARKESKQIKTGIAGLDKSDEVILEEIDALNRADTGALYETETSICRKTKHHYFNRHNDCNLVWNRTLVPLSSKKYINANFLYKGLMIGTQAPLAHTREDFWQMILDQQCRVVVMLNEQKEIVERLYLPERKNQTCRFGDIEVRVIEEPTIEVHANWRQSPYEEEIHGIRRKMIEACRGDQRQTLVHLQYINWKDMGVGHPGCLASLISKIYEEQGMTSTAPVVVHCAAGVGRTAAFASIYQQYRLWKAGGEIDVRKSVEELRSPNQGRYHRMVQAHEQYQLCYETLRLLVDSNMPGYDEGNWG